MTLHTVKRPPLRTILARRLREVAAERGVALTHVADRAGIGRSHMWRLLNAEASPTLDAVEKIADALDIDPLALLAPAPQTHAVAAEPVHRQPRATHGAASARSPRRR